MNLRQLPNAITVARMLTVPPLLWALHAGNFRAALWIAVAAGLSDALDGWLAKRHGWQSWLGGILDPIADKLLLDASFIGLWSVAAVPGWMASLVIGRDVVIVAGAAFYHFLIGTLTGRPTLLSKITTVAQISYVVVLLFGLAWWPLPTDAVFAMTFAVAALTFASGLDYVVRWGLRARKTWRARRG